MALLRRVRGRGRGLKRVSRAVASAALMVGVVLGAQACEPSDPELLPDERLRTELGLTDADRVHTVRLLAGDGEQADPDSLEVRPGDLVQFVTADWLVHEVRFDMASLGVAERDFLERTGQSGSPPLLQEDARFVVSFREAPAGRYSFRLEGNRAPGAGVVVVAPEGAR